MFKRYTIPSPPGTFLVTTSSLALITKPEVRRLYILRIIRYVSYYHWGSLRSTLNRSGKSIQLAIDRLWRGNPVAMGMPAFTPGSGVLFSPIMIGVEGGLKLSFPRKGAVYTDEYAPAWLAHRIPPYNKKHNLSKIDIGVELLRRILTPDASKYWEFLYDARFVVRIDLENVPPWITDALANKKAALLINLRNKWGLPKIVFLPTDDVAKTLHTVVSTVGEGTLLMPSMMGFEQPDDNIAAPWVTIEAIRRQAAI